MIDVIAAGDVFLDLIFSGFASLPSLGEEAFAKRLDREIGGGASITACGLARLGLRTSLLSSVGRDDSTWLRTRLKDYGVDDSLLQPHASEPTATSVSISTDTDRLFYTYQGANAYLDIRPQTLPRARCMHLALRPQNNAARIIEELQARNFLVTLDVGWHPDWLQDQANRLCLRAVDAFFPNEKEAFVITGETDPVAALRRFEQMKLSRVALKRGSAGASLLWHGEIFHCPAWPVQCIDTTGAGDCFNAGFLAGWLAGEDPVECLQIAVFCGSQSTRVAGGPGGFPEKESLAEWRMNQRLP